MGKEGREREEERERGIRSSLFGVQVVLQQQVCCRSEVMHGGP